MTWWNARRTRTKVILVVVALFLALIAFSPKSATPASTGTVPIAAGSEAPAATSVQSPTAAPTPKPTPSPVVIQGRGQTATDAFTLPAPISIAAFTHNGSRNFIVEAFVGNSSNPDLLVNTIGNYSGQRPLTGTQPIRLNIEADGAWTVTVTAIQCCATSGAYNGSGDAVSNQFNPPGTGAWQFTNSGRRNFIVELHCAGGDQVVQNRIGSFDGSTILVFPRGPCYWEVQSDGTWSMAPR